MHIITVVSGGSKRGIVLVRAASRCCLYLTYNQPHPKNILIGLKNHNGTSSGLASRTCRVQVVLETKMRPNRHKGDREREREKEEENNKNRQFLFSALSILFRTKIYNSLDVRLAKEIKNYIVLEDFLD